MSIINLSESASNAALDSIGQMMNGGSIELLSGDGSFLVSLRLGNPATQPASDGELSFAEIHEGVAQVTAIAEFGRILAKDGTEILSCDCGNAESDATIRLTPVLITKNAPVKINSFRLSMP